MVKASLVYIGIAVDSFEGQFSTSPIHLDLVNMFSTKSSPK